nr:efflux transporter outer membrane subunit [Rickettsia endosymbiont of Ceutorhynchus assimilis]
MNQVSILLFILLSVSLFSCQLAPNYKKPAIELPDSFDKSYIEKKEVIAQQSQWWTKFNDPDLEALITESLNANSDILIAMTNVAQAQAQLNLNNAQRFPQINLQGSANRTKNSKQVNSKNNNINHNIVNNFSLASVLNYEIDLWGAAANADKAAQALLVSAEENKQAVRQSVATNTAIAYFNLLALHKQIYLTSHLITIQKKIYELNNKLFLAGTSNEIDLSQAQSLLTVTESELPILQQQLQEQKHALEILLGRTPKDIVNGSFNHNQTIDKLVAPMVPEILPSKLLEQRPDIRAAEQNLIAANSNIGVVRATYFPNLSLTGLLGLGSNKAAKLFNDSAHSWQIGGSSAMPIIDFGRTKANVQIAKITQEQYVIQYRNIVAVAFREVMDALSAQKTSEDNFNIWQRNEKALETSARLIKQRQRRGIANYLDVLNAEQSVLQAQISGVTIKLNRLNAAVNLFHALGGEW